MKNSDMPAMPNSNTGTYPNPCPVEWGHGLTKREQVLKDFMVAILSNPNTDYCFTLDSDGLSKHAMKFVDSYFKELEK